MHNRTTKLNTCPNGLGERKRKHISLFIQPSLSEVIALAAERNSVPVSRLFRAAIEHYAEQVL